MNGFDRLSQMLKEWIEKHDEDEAFIETVNYLLERKELEPKFLNKEKNLDDLYDFIQQRAKQHMHNGWCYISNNIVYSWGVMYFTLPNSYLKIKSDKKDKTTNNSTTNNNVISIEKAKEKQAEKQNYQISFFGGDSE